MQAIETDRTTAGVELNRVRVPLSSMLINRQPARGGGGGGRWLPSVAIIVISNLVIRASEHRAQLFLHCRDYCPPTL